MDKLEQLKKELNEYLDSMLGAVEDMLDDLQPCNTGTYNQKANSYLHNAKLMAEIAECNGFIAEIKSIVNKY